VLKPGKVEGQITIHYLKTRTNGDCWDVRLDYVRQFKSELVRRLEGLVFEKKKFHSNEREIEREREREREKEREREREVYQPNLT
jgi:hypothetical protein